MAERSTQEPVRIAYYLAYPYSLAGATRSLLELITHLPLDIQPLVIVPEEGLVAEACRRQGLRCRVLRPGRSLMAFGKAALAWPAWQRAWVFSKELVPYTLVLVRELRRERIDLLHVNCPRGALLAGPAGRLLKIPVVGHVRGRAPVTGAYWRAFELLCDRIITVCDAVQLDLSSRARAKAVTVYNGTRDLLAVREAAPPGPVRLRWLAAERGRGRLVVSCFASLTPFKGQHHLLEAIAQLNRQGLGERALFLCVGKVQDSDREYEAWLWQRMQELSIDNLTFVGWTDDPFEFYAQTDVTVLPSVDAETLRLGSRVLHIVGTEGFPRTHLEAMALALPVVATDIAGVPEQVVDGVTGFVVPPGSGSGLAEAMAKLLTSAELRRRMGQAGHRRVKELFSIERCVTSTLEVYRSLLGERWLGESVERMIRSPKGQVEGMGDRWRAQGEGETDAGMQTCPACAGSTAQWVKRTNRLRFARGLTLEALRCSRCAHRWLPTTPEEQRQIEARYDDHYAGFRVDPYFNAVVTEELARRLVAIVPPPAALLDVGCGNGEFLSLATAAGYSTRGIDVSEAAAESCRRRGLEVCAGDFLSRSFDQKFDIITMWDVMEHLRSPGDFAQRAASLLAPGGVLLLKIPSKGGLNFSLLRLVSGRGGLLLGAPSHVQFFSEPSLRRLLARAGFSEILWFESKGFRGGQPRTFRPKKLLGRALTRLISRLARDHNLYVVVTRSSFPEGVIRRIHYRHLERLSESE